MPGTTHSTLTQAAVQEIEELLRSSRRRLSDFYRAHKSGLTLDEIARTTGAPDLKKAKDDMSALRVIFGREPLPKRGGGRQAVIYEAEFWLKSDRFLSQEVLEHFEKILKQAEKTNTRRSEFYEPPLPPRSYSLKDRPKEGDYPAVYVLTSNKFLQDTHDGFTKVKIGWSLKVWDRIASAQTWDPEPITVLRLYPCYDPHSMEAKFHIVLDALNLGVVAGGGIEWFDTRLALVDEIALSLGLVNEPLQPTS